MKIDPKDITPINMVENLKESEIQPYQKEVIKQVKDWDTKKDSIILPIRG